MAEQMQSQIDYIGRTIGAAALSVGGAESVVAVWEAASRHLYGSLGLGALAVFTLSTGNYFWKKSGEILSVKEQTEPSVPTCSYDYQWVEEIGWVPLEPYDVVGPAVG